MGEVQEPKSNSPNDKSVRNPHTRLWMRYIGIFLISGIVLAMLVNSTLAWGFVWFLLHPGCDRSNSSESLPEPVEVWLSSSEDAKIKSWYYPPSNGVVIITVGGLQGALGDNLPPVRFILEHGYGVLQLDSRACGMPPRPVTLGAHEVDDVSAALEFLHSQPNVSGIGIFGFSMGGAAALMSAARYPEIKAVVAEGGYYNLGDDFVEPDNRERFARRVFLYTVAWSYWLQSGDNPWQVSPIDDIAKISPRPLMLVYGEYEAGSGRAQAQFDAASEPKSIWIVPGGTHGTNHLVEPVEYPRRVLEFFNQAFDYKSK